MIDKNTQSANQTGEFLLYQTEDGSSRIQCRFEGETIWLTQAQLAELFQTTPQNITLHLKAVFAEGELNEMATCKDYLQVRQEGGREVSRNLRHYNLSAILAVGFRVRSHRGTQFRQWATGVLRDFAIRGYVLDKELLKNGAFLSKDYYENLLAKIRAISSLPRMRESRNGYSA
ncbi:MAG: RhuM family protein [Gallionella sp.]|nr:RhuM family protein [Gallionella sp.]